MKHELLGPELVPEQQQGNTIDECLQPSVGGPWMAESVIERLYAVGRIQRIDGGTMDTMKDFSSRGLGA